MTNKKKGSGLLLGMIDSDLFMALLNNILSWFVHHYCPPSSYVRDYFITNYLLPKIPQELIIIPPSTTETTKTPKTPTTDPRTTGAAAATTNNQGLTNTQCIVIGRPGGIEQLRCITLQRHIATRGYNVVVVASASDCRSQGEGDDNDKKKNGPFTDAKHLDDNGDMILPKDCVVVQVHAFSINYADCCIRWGLYESANEYVGYPIVPGFDIAGRIERVGTAVTDFTVGDAVFGCTLFGGYSTRVLVPALQIRKIPTRTTPTITRSPSPTQDLSTLSLLSMTQAASLPAVALTSLYALYLAGQYHPCNNSNNNSKSSEDDAGSKNASVSSLFTNKSILIHSAAGGVGSMLVQIASKILQLYPVVGIVGHSSKVDEAKLLGCHVVIDKSQYTTKNELWKAIREANNYDNNNGYYATIMDSNGIDTIQQSYDCLGQAGRLILYGFHTNLPMGADALSPLSWMKMAVKMIQMPKFDGMDMVTSNKAVLGFNLSFFANERTVLSKLFDQITVWIQNDQLRYPRITEMNGMDQIPTAHNLLQSGKTVGKIVITTPYYEQQQEES